MSSTDIKGELRDLLLRIDHHHSVERQVQTSVLADAIKHITTLEEENADLCAQHAERVRSEGVRIDVSLLDADSTDYVPRMKQLIAEHGTAPAALRFLLDFYQKKSASAK